MPIGAKLHYLQINYCWRNDDVKLIIFSKEKSFLANIKRLNLINIGPHRFIRQILAQIKLGYIYNSSSYNLSINLIS